MSFVFISPSVFFGQVGHVGRGHMVLMTWSIFRMAEGVSGLTLDFIYYSIFHYWGCLTLNGIVHGD